MKIETLKTGDLIPYAKNSRTHSEGQISQIAGSIREFGFTNPVLIDGENGIIAGHGRVMAAQLLGIDKVPCIRLGHLTDTQRRAYIIADNKLAINSGWDDEMLLLEIADLQDSDFDISLLGFSDVELADILAETNEGETDPDEVPEAPENPTSVEGDVWILGKHRIVCGSCTDMGTVEKCLNGVKPHLMVTDPPYGVEYDPEWRNKAARKSPGMGNRAIGAGAVGVVLNDDRADWTDAWALFPGDVAYVWHAGLHTRTVIDSLESCTFKPRALIIWAKQQFAIGRGDYHHQHEPCWYVVRKNAVGHWAGDRKQSTLWQIPKPQKSETGHSTQKPVECMKRPIENNSSPGQAVYEPFSGSGTTIIAGEMTGRSIHAIELNPAYVDVAVKRWQDFTGKEAKLESTGETFAEMQAKKTK